MRNAEMTGEGGPDAAVSGTGDVRVCSDGDPRVVELRGAVRRLRHQLAAHPADFTDRLIAENELDRLAVLAADPAPEVPALRCSLLLVAGSLGSVSALVPALAELRGAVELLGGPQV